MDINFILEWSQRIFATPFVALLLICGAWSVFVTGTALEEQELQREARLAKRAGWFYMGLAAVGFVFSRGCAIFFP